MSYKRTRYGIDDLTGSLNALAGDLGRVPTVADVRNLSEILPDVSTLERRAGSWKAALELAGMESRHGMSDESYLRELWQLCQRLGHRPTKREINETPGVPSYTSFRMKFGGVVTACAAAEALFGSRAEG